MENQVNKLQFLQCGKKHTRIYHLWILRNMRKKSVVVLCAYECLPVYECHPKSIYWVLFRSHHIDSKINFFFKSSLWHWHCFMNIFFHIIYTQIFFLTIGENPISCYRIKFKSENDFTKKYILINHGILFWYCMIQRTK